MSSAKIFASYYRPHWKLFLLDMVCATFVAMMDLIFPIFSRMFINDFIPNGEIQSILIFSLVLTGLYTLRMVGQYIMNYWGHLVGARIETDMRSDLFRHIQTLPFTYFDNNKTGQIMSRLVGDLREIGELAHHGPEDLFVSGLMIIGSFFILIKVNVILTIIIFAVVILLIIFAMSKRVAMIKAFRNVRNTHAGINARIESSISGIRLCKSFANEEYEINNFEMTNLEYRESWNSAYKVMAEYSTGTNYLLEMLTVISLGLGGYFVFLGAINYGDLVAFLLYMTFMIKPIRQLIQFTQQYQSGIAGFNRFLEVKQIKTDIKEAQNAVALNHPKGDIEFHDVSFSYNNQKDLIFNHFNFHIPQGKTIALVGPSGVGKTTLAHLIPRFYDVVDGKITIDGKDIKELTLHSLRQNTGFVQQDVFIFFGTIRDNILYGKPDATDEEMFEAAKRANIHDFIMSLPDKYYSLVGERGVKLSGGQKQRIAIARVFLKNPNILILDEATSSLDNATEYMIQQSIEELTKNRTTLIIAHRLSTIKHADEIIVLTDDGIAERGTHEQLLEKKGIYEKLFQAQFQGYLPDQLS